MINFSERRHRVDAIITGVFFIAAAVTSIIGLKLYQPAITGDDYLTQASLHTQPVIIGALNELFLVATASGTGIMLYPYLRRYNEQMGLAYFCFRLLEAILILIGTLSVLAIVSLSKAYAANPAADVGAYKAVGTALIAIHDWTFMLGPNFMLGINTFIYSYVFFKSRLIPRALSVIGIVGAIMIFIAAHLEMFGVMKQLSVGGMVMAIPIFIYEMSLAVYLIVKGFNINAIKSLQ
ncbi:MAG: DUF4386 domain-containing protein [Chitinophagales bacterium]|nr:DUF4386 domain-containing protein [Chitinophagales bacterium]